MKDIKTLIILGLLVWVVLLSTCNSSDPLEPEIITNETVRVINTHTVDTIIEKIRVPYAVVPLVNVEPVFNIDLSDTSEFSTNTYTYTKKDSLLSYEIKVDGECEPVNVRIKYDLNQFTIRDSTYIRDSTHVKEALRKSFMSAGVIVTAGKEDFGFAPSLSYNHKKGSSFLLGYDLINKRVAFGFHKKIKFKR